jgi:pimeloyl-ACP methyl ester carboxylesterase
MVYLGIIITVILCVFIYAGILSKIYTLHDMPDQIHFITTADNVRIALFRYTPKGGTRHPGPILFCHGLGANMHNFDVTESYSLARYMADSGHDTWILNLRGADVKGVIEYHDWDFNFDDFVKKDIPSAVSYVLNETHAQKLSWIGHSMGGMLLYAYLLSGGDTFVVAGVTLGSPVSFVSSEKNLSGLLKLRALLKLMKKVHANLFARFLTPLTGIINTAFIKSQMNVQNVDPRIIRIAQYNAVTPVSAKLLSQFADWAGKHGIALADGFKITENLNRIVTPLLVISGKGDRLSPVDDTVYAYNQVRSARKTYIELSVENGFSADYGHIDMVFGKHAPAEVYPLIKEWLGSTLSAVP